MDPLMIAVTCSAETCRMADVDKNHFENNRDIAKRGRGCVN